MEIKPLGKKDFKKIFNKINIGKIVDKIDIDKNKNKIIIGSIAVLITIIILFVITLKTKTSAKDNETIRYSDNGSMTVDVVYPNNKAKDFELSLEKNNKLVLEKVIKRKDNELTETVDIKNVLYKNGFGFYELKVKFNSGMKRYKRKISFTKVPEVKNAVVETDYYKGKYTLNIEGIPDVKKYEIRVQKDSQVEMYTHDVKEDETNIKIDVTSAVSKFGSGVYTVQIDNIINDFVRGLPKIIQFNAKKVMEKPNADIMTTYLDRKVLKIKPNDLAYEYEVQMTDTSGNTCQTNVKSEFNITDYLYNNAKAEGFYNIRIKPLVNATDVIVSENTENSSVLVLENVPIKFTIPEVKEIRLNQTIISNRPEIIFNTMDKENYKYYIQIKSNKINKLVEYGDLEDSILANKYLLKKEEIDSLALDEKVEITVYKENIKTKEKSYPYSKKLIKKEKNDLIKFGYMEVVE